MNAYNYNEKKLSNLIYEISQIKNLNRIRYSTSHPLDFSQDLIKSHGNIKKLMPLIHLPVQSGSDKILKNMNRKHTIKQYLDVIYELKKTNPLIKFSSDIIIGYPGETEKDFENTLKLLKEVEYINSYSFIFSPRPGTPAAKMKKQLRVVFLKRLIVFQKTAEQIKMKYRSSLFNKFSNVLFENRIGNKDEFFGRDEYSNSVIVKSKENLKGKIEKVKIIDGNQNTLFGEVVSESRKSFCSVKMSEISKLDQNLIIKKIDKETTNIQITENDILMSVVGQFDQNLKHLSKLTNTNVFFRGNSITCKGKGENISIFCEAVKFLINKYILTKIIEKEDIVLSVNKNMEREKSNVQSFQQLIKTPRKSVIARSEKQSDYIKALKENDIVMSSDQLELEKFSSGFSRGKFAI